MVLIVMIHCLSPMQTRAFVEIYFERLLSNSMLWIIEYCKIYVAYKHIYIYMYICMNRETISGPPQSNKPNFRRATYEL